MPAPPVQVPWIFANLPNGATPMSYFDENFAFIINNVAAIVAQQFFSNLPTHPPLTPNTLWNNGGVISITPP